MVNNQSRKIISNLEAFFAVRTNENAYVQIFLTRDVLFSRLLREPFREQTTVSCSLITFSNIRVRAPPLAY